MIIDKKDIEAAKEKLGDQNAFIMAELLDLQDFDEKDLKACCPYHCENTPSFVYDKIRYRFKCFGCNRTVDLIDVLMEKGKTFLDAARYLFEKVDIPYSFGEQSVRTKENYKYPHEEPFNDKKNVLEYWGKRGISKDVIDYLDIREDSKGNGVFNFYDTNDVLTMVKYRPARTIEKQSKEPKTWCQKDADTSPILFNMNRVNVSKPLLVCEGETDCASVIEAGYLNTVSVPLGAGNLHWIEENFEWLDEFSDIIIWSDNDEPGIKMRKECINRLGSWKTKYIETPPYFIKEDGKRIKLKDANDCLQAGGKEFVMKLVNGAKDIPVDGVIDYADVEEADMSQMDGVEFGVKPIDDELGKLYYGTLTILTGKSGSGKTSITDQLIGNSMDMGIPVFLYSQEMPTKMLTGWLNVIMAGRRNIAEKTNIKGEKYYVVPYEKQKKIQGYYKEKLYLYKDDQSNDEDVIVNAMEGCIRKYGVKLLVLDNLLGINLNQAQDGKNTEQTNFVNRMLKLAAKYNVAIVLVAHPRKSANGVNVAEVGLTLDDVAGSSNIGNLAHRALGLRRVTKKEKEDPKCKHGKYDVIFSVFKDRLLGRIDTQIGIYYDNPSRRFYTDYEEYDHQYSWDNNLYTNKLPYVDKTQKLEQSPFE